jgi:hypothetical protein
MAVFLIRMCNTFLLVLPSAARTANGPGGHLPSCLRWFGKLDRLSTNASACLIQSACHSAKPGANGLL